MENLQSHTPHFVINALEKIGIFKQLVCGLQEGSQKALASLWVLHSIPIDRLSQFKPGFFVDDQSPTHESRDRK